MSVHREDGEVVIKVKDDGIGIAPGDLTQIFGMFFQVGSESKPFHNGLGIGLALAKGLVEMHGGRLSAQSEGIGKGSEFIVRLPVTDSEITTAESAGPKSDVARPAAPQSRILVVDDMRDSADSLGMLLELMGHSVQTTYDGEQAVRMAEQFRPDLVLIDLGMPGMNGTEVCRRIRSHPWGATMVLIAQTGWGQEYDRHRTREAGFDHHLVKPLDVGALDGLLRRVSARTTASAGSAHE